MELCRVVLDSTTTSALKRHRLRLFEIQLFESTELSDAFVPGMRGVVPGHDLARPSITQRVIDLEGDFWRMSALRVWHMLVAGLFATWLLLAACLLGSATSDAATLEALEPLQLQALKVHG